MIMHAPSQPLPGSLVRVRWYAGDPDVVPTMTGIIMALEPHWGTAEVLVTSTGSGETWIRRCPMRELEVVEQ